MSLCQAKKARPGYMQADNSLPKEAIEEFKRLYKKIYKIELSDEEAKRRASNLFSLYIAVYGSGSKKVEA